MGSYSQPRTGKARAVHVIPGYLWRVGFSFVQISPRGPPGGPQGGYHKTPFPEAYGAVELGIRVSRLYLGACKISDLLAKSMLVS